MNQPPDLQSALREASVITVVIAGNFRQFVEWCRANDRKPYGRDVRYAGSPASIVGMRGIEVVRTGTWSDRKDLEEIEALLAANLRKQGAMPS